MNGRLVLAALTLLLQSAVGWHGYRSWQEERHRPLRVSVGMLAVREDSEGSWHASDLSHGSRMQITVQATEPVRPLLVRIRASDGGVARLYPAPGHCCEQSEPGTAGKRLGGGGLLSLRAGAWYSLPSPTSWYDLEALLPGDRLLLLLQRPDGAVAPDGPLSADDIRSLLRRSDSTSPSGRSQTIELPLPDGGKAAVEVTESLATEEAVRAEWTLGPR